MNALTFEQRIALREQINQRVRARASYRQIEKREQLLDDLIAGRVNKSGGRRINACDPIWTEVRIIAAIRRWTADHGQPPTVNEWFVAGDDRPARATVANRFGSWNAAIAAAGFQPRRQGHSRVGAASAGRATGGALRTPSGVSPSSAPPTSTKETGR